LPAAPKSSPIRLSEPQWEQALADATHLTLDSWLQAASAVVTATAGNDAATLRQTASSLAAETLEIAETACCLGVFSAAGSGPVTAFVHHLGDRTGALLDAVASADPPDDADAFTGPVAIARGPVIAPSDAFVSSAREAALGIDLSAVDRARGPFPAARVLSAFYGRPDELRNRTGAILRVFTDARGADAVDELRCVEAFMLRRSYVAVRVCRAVQRLIKQAMREDAHRTGSVLVDLREKVDVSAENHLATNKMIRSTKGASERDIAVTTLEIYRRKLEGQLRPWAWTLLRLSGVNAPAMPPMATELRDRLAASGDRFLEGIAGAIVVDARNAAAHEQYRWDHTTGTLDIGSRQIGAGELQSTIDWIDAFIGGAEVAWAISRWESPELVHAMDGDLPPAPSGVMAAMKALHRFGSNGLRVSSYEQDELTFLVVLDELPYDKTNPCFKAVLQASRLLPLVQAFKVAVDGHAHHAVEVTRADLDRTLIIMERTIQALKAGHLDLIPMTAFLPINLASRLTVEDPQTAARAMAWLAADDAVGAFRDAGELGTPRTAAALASRREIAAMALEACQPQLPYEPAADLRHARDVIVTAQRWAALTAQGSYLMIAGAPMLDRMWALYDSLPTPSLLPTLDPRTMDVVDP
jgi:hypothetical protein